MDNTEVIQEEWRPVVGYEEFYMVSNLGRVKSLDRYPNGSVVLKVGKLMNPPTYSKGYLIQKLYRKGKYIRVGVHRLVVEAFIPKIEGKTIVNHKDGNKQNNCVSNLEWCTHHENHIHAMNTGLKATGERHGMSKLTTETVLRIREDFKSGKWQQRTLGKLYGLSQATVANIGKGKSWKNI